MHMERRFQHVMTNGPPLEVCDLIGRSAEQPKRLPPGQVTAELAFSAPSCNSLRSHSHKRSGSEHTTLKPRADGRLRSAGAKSLLEGDEMMILLKLSRRERVVAPYGCVSRTTPAAPCLSSPVDRSAILGPPNSS